MLSNNRGGSVLDLAAIEPGPPGDNDETRVTHTNDGLDHSPDDSDMHLSKRKRLVGKVKSVLHVNNDQLNDIGGPRFVALAASPDVTSGEARLDDGPPLKPGPKGFKDLVHHPVDTVKAKTERKTNKEVAVNLLSPEVTHAQDVELIHAQDTADTADTEGEKLQACHDLETLKKARQGLFVRWTMDRHVLKLKRLESKEQQDRRHRETISQTDSAGWKSYSHQLVLQQAEKYGGQYIGFFSEPPPASQETVSASIERILVASTPWQELIMHIRRIYRWENQNETLAYLAAFMALWATGALCAVGCLALIGQVLRRRFEKPSVEKLRQDIMCIEDPSSTGHTLSEQIEKRGAQSWIEPLIEDMGEWLLLQLGDTANLLEVLLNFYEWRQPARTAWTLVWLGTGCVAFYMTPVWLLVKTVSLFSGLTFFALFPIASRYPRYRLLASPIKWLFWGIPSHAEWAIARLQAEGSRQAHNTNAHLSAGSDSYPKDLRSKVVVHGSYTCSSAKHSGRLVVTSEGVRFQSFVGSRHDWALNYDNMNRVEKVNTIVEGGSGKDLRFVDADNVAYSASNVARRDEVFTQVVGYSSIEWQVVG